MRLYLGHALKLVGESKYRALMCGLVRVASRVAVRLNRRFRHQIQQSKLTLAIRRQSVIDAKRTHLSADGVIIEKMSITFPSLAAPLLASIIVPCFNNGRFVRQSVESALSQTVQSLEVIVIDDGSTDPATKKAISDLEHLAKVRVVRQENRGIPGARNTGITLAAGEYVCCLDADNVLEPTYIEMVIAVLESNRSIGFSYSWVQLFGHDATVWRSRDFVIDEALIDSQIAVAAVFRRDDWIAVGGFRPDTRLGYEDREFWLCLAALGRRGRVLRTPLLNHRRPTTTQNAHGSRRNLIEIIRERNRSIFECKRLRKRIAAVFSPPVAGEPLAVFRRPSVLVPPDRRPHLLVLAPWLADGGSEILLLDLLSDLKTDWRISIVTTNADEQLLWPHFREITTDVVPLVGAFDEHLWFSVLDHVIVTRGTRAMISHGSAFAYETLSSVKQRHPRMATIDILHNDLPGGHMRGAVMARASIDCQIAVSSRIARSLLSHGVLPERIVTIPNGVDTEVLFTPRRFDRSKARLTLHLPPECLILAWIGRLAEEKRPLEFLTIIAELAQRGPVRALMVGDGPMAAAVDDKIQRLALKDLVKRIPQIPRGDIGQIYAAADFLVLTSAIEGLPFVALEALASGCPVAATDVGDMESIVTHGENGFLVPADRTSELTKFFGSEELASKLTRFRLNARQSIERSQFTAARMRAGYRECLANLLAMTENEQSTGASGQNRNPPVLSIANDAAYHGR